MLSYSLVIINKSIYNLELGKEEYKYQDRFISLSWIHFLVMNSFIFNDQWIHLGFYFYHQNKDINYSILFFFSDCIFFWICIFLFYFIFKLYIIVLVLPNIKMNPPQVYMCSPSWTLLPPPSPYHPSVSSQCSSPKHPVSCIERGLATRFILNSAHSLLCCLPV